MFISGCSQVNVAPSPAIPDVSDPPIPETQNPNPTLTDTFPTETGLKGKITVLAASSLTEPFTEIGRLFEEQNPNATVEFSFANSQQLAQQLILGASADVFASASLKNMTDVVQAGLIEPDKTEYFAENKLVMVYPNKNQIKLKDLHDLAMPGIKLVLAASQTPIGQYTLEFLSKAEQNPNYGIGFQTKVIENVVSYEDSVKAVLAKVTLGEADAGIVFQSDVTGDAKDLVGVIPIPDELNIMAQYSIGALNKDREPELSSKFVNLVLSPAGQEILKRYGFLPVTNK